MQDTRCRSILKPALLRTARLLLSTVPHLRNLWAPLVLTSRSYLQGWFLLNLLFGIPMATPCRMAFHSHPHADTAILASVLRPRGKKTLVSMQLNMCTRTCNASHHLHKQKFLQS